MSEDRRVYCKSCQQTFITDAAVKCPLCSAQDSLISPEEAELHMARQLAARANEPTINPHEVVRGAVRGYRLLRALFGVASLEVVGGYFLFDPTLRGHSGPPNWNDVMQAAPVFLAALIVMGWGVWSSLRQ
jgi:hypothetical protein